MNNALALPQNLSVGSFDQYLISVTQLPKLNAEEERRLALRFRETGDLEAARQLVMANLRFVVHIARGYRGYGLALPDLVQEGNIGLMKAVKRFDPDVGVRLVSFAVHWIRAEIHEFVIRNWRIVKIATTKAQRKLFFNLKKSKKRLGWLNAHEAHAVAGDLGVKVETVYEMENRLDSHDLAFDTPVNEDPEESGNFCPSTYLAASQASDPAAMLESSEWDRYKQTRLHDALDQLDDRSRDILASRWLNDEKSTLHELADRYSVSAERIRQLEKNAMKKLKEAIA
ncbi:MAG: RNA polymerase sigma factor RpoH [Methylococcaceae bacterium]|nr:RNA polymerase sigma factor RpoH [Methylococcaceae bacterium]MCI0668702.1 RNA polymerase sigma factor RpoH [Methylococcaceae bacterium]MCI0733349.1 RNA polymerase sigma factor RpoH [Methylococcaceae bacterium]